MYGLNPRGQYFQDLCERLFNYQERFGIIEPKAPYFLPLLIETAQVQEFLSRKGVSLNTLNTMLNATMILEAPMSWEHTASFRNGVFYPAAFPKAGSLSAVFKNSELDGRLKQIRENQFEEYITSPGSEHVTSAVETILIEMENERIEISDLNLLLKLLSSGIHIEDEYAIQNTLKTCGVTAEKLAEESEPVEVPALLRFGV